MRLSLNPLFVLAIITSGVVGVFFAPAEQGSWSLIFPMPLASQPATGSEEPLAQNAARVSITAMQGQSTSDRSACTPGRQLSGKQCLTTHPLAEKRSRSGFFAGLMNDAAKGSPVTIWRTGPGILADPGAVVGDATRTVAAFVASCVAGRCGAVANPAPDLVHSIQTQVSAIAAVEAPRAV